MVVERQVGAELEEESGASARADGEIDAPLGTHAGDEPADEQIDDPLDACPVMVVRHHVIVDRRR
ncbi:hypothetical protein [Frankia sp. AgB32]|uniref:hypothetical protein n=1 Tax=Frankia sp. AgB32 TaxID=631119 RepID=UPI0020107496|nr:hypothetical protein [Frankia sp. AgB32]MCK9894496.1 hypothetical protein [Frankia sp. AgB32]